MDNKIELLKNISILSQLSADELKIFSGFCEFIDLNEGAIIFEKSDNSKSFYVVDSGEVRIVNITKEKEENVLADFLPGEIFGEFDLFENDPRTATAIANIESRLLVFPKHEEEFDKLFKKYPGIFVKIYHNLITVNAGRIRLTNKLVSEKNSWVKDLKNQVLIDKLTGFYNRAFLEDEFPNILAQNKDKVGIVVVKPDDFKSVNDNFGHEAGDIALKTISNAVRSHLLDNETPVRYRGNEFIVIYLNTGLNEARKKSKKLHSALSDIDIGRVIANKSLKLNYSMGISVYPDHADNINSLIDMAFAKMFEQRNNGGNGILFVVENVEDITDITRFLKSVDAFSSLYLSELKEISKYLKPVKIDKGGILCKEGEEGRELYIIESGKISVNIKLQGDAEKEITEFSSGDFFGEMSIFENEKRSATCVAKEESKIYIFNKNDFLTIMRDNPLIAIKIMREMLDITSTRLTNTSKFLSEMVKWGEEASKRAITDELTGIYNRRYLESSLDELFNRATRERKPISLIMADMDFFREVNEIYSHEIGDKYIVEAANIFKKCLRETDIIARYGGDEFTIILPDTTIKEASELAENIRISVEKLDFLKNFPGPEIKLSLSQGIASYPENCDSLSTLKALADKALYKAKAEGRNRVASTS